MSKPLVGLLSLIAIIVFMADVRAAKDMNPPIKLTRQNQLLLDKLKKPYKENQTLLKIKEEILSEGPKAVPVLVQVMKNPHYPDKNRWVSTFLLGRIMGKKASPFIAKFGSHPNWVLRLASLKTLLALKDRRYGGLFASKLKDKSMLVRVQALENIKELKLRKYSSHIWSMLYDKQNYNKSQKGQKRTQLVKSAIRAVGELKFEKAQEPLLSMIQKKKYVDIFDEIDYSLELISGKESPEGTIEVKKLFWQKFAMANKTI